ncbi:hypothetical protein M433DRAFT_348482 [Acidomyces richmondensis BFW]|nr:MAG: hypothetical protein FE78DRAFT_33786 [Acidomyces sp. 'richmondensis']KYG49150.1 hypothetical protein M433DRAFT_348482 [Acidomyces richmondensis BFW]
MSDAAPIIEYVHRIRAGIHEAYNSFERQFNINWQEHEEKMAEHRREESLDPYLSPLVSKYRIWETERQFLNARTALLNGLDGHNFAPFISRTQVVPEQEQGAIFAAATDSNEASKIVLQLALDRMDEIHRKMGIVEQDWFDTMRFIESAAIELAKLLEVYRDRRLYEEEHMQDSIPPFPPGFGFASSRLYRELLYLHYHAWRCGMRSTRQTVIREFFQPQFWRTDPNLNVGVNLMDEFRYMWSYGGRYNTTEDHVTDKALMFLHLDPLRQAGSESSNSDDEGFGRLRTAPVWDLDNRALTPVGGEGGDELDNVHHESYRGAGRLHSNPVVRERGQRLITQFYSELQNTYPTSCMRLGGERAKSSKGWRFRQRLIKDFFQPQSS